MKTHVAVYTRVSTRQQKDRSQKDALLRWLAAQNGIGPTKWYEDKASGKSMDRPAWGRLEDAIHKGQVARLVVFRLDRLGRTVSGLSRLFDLLRERGVKFTSVSENLDLDSPAGRLVLHTLASVAAYEREVIGERVRAGQAAAKTRGVRWGGSKPGHGSKLTPELLAAVEDAQTRGLSKTATARLLTVSRPTVYAALRRIASENPVSRRGANG